jgi:ribonuclease BN (tRNA processing enzyme)
MKIRILGPSAQDVPLRQYLSSYLINETVAIDAGCLGFWSTPQAQEAVRHVFLTHSHIDHTASLPIFAENAWTPTDDCPLIYGGTETINDVQKHIFNDHIWPNFIALSETMPPFLRVREIHPEEPVDVDGLSITPVNVNHVVPTFGYVVSDGRSAVIFGGDSGPTERLWEIAHQTPDLRAVFLEACFPNSMTFLAKASLHMTPEMFAREVAKMPTGVMVVAVHMKVRYRDRIIQELNDLKLPNLEIGRCDKVYDSLLCPA